MKGDRHVFEVELTEEGHGWNPDEFGAPDTWEAEDLADALSHEAFSWRLRDYTFEKAGS